MNRLRSPLRVAPLCAAILCGAALPAQGADAPASEPSNASEPARPRVDDRTAAEPTRARLDERSANESRPRAEERSERQWLTDAELSHAANKLLEQAHPVEGAAVLVDVRSGRILVFSELRHGGAPGSVITQAKAPAASVFKLVTTAALFELGGVRPADRVCISGGVKSIERRHLDAPRGGLQSCGSFAQALGHSRNAVYAQLATRRLSRQDLVDIAERLGFNSVLPFDWPVTVGKLVVPYNDLEFARTAAGFENSTLSPLGGAYLASIIARGGLAPRFHLVAADTEAEAQPDALRVLSPTTARRMTRMMEVTTASGTSRPVFNDELGHSLLPGVRVAGKTGTLRPGTSQETTSWFVGFAPSDRPEVAISVMLENRPVWRQRAAEVARDLLRVYFHRRGGMTHISDPLNPE